MFWKRRWFLEHIARRWAALEPDHFLIFAAGVCFLGIIVMACTL